MTAPTIAQQLQRLEVAALDGEPAAAEIHGHQVRALVREQLRGGRSRVRSICWEVDGAGIARAGLLAMLTRAARQAEPQS